MRSEAEDEVHMPVEQIAVRNIISRTLDDSRYSFACMLCFRLVPPVAPARPASPLPPGVPTGPRNQNKYKDRDNNAPAVDGLDYGGTNKDSGGGRTPSGEPEDRSSSR